MDHDTIGLSSAMDRLDQKDRATSSAVPNGRQLRAVAALDAVIACWRLTGEPRSGVASRTVIVSPRQSTASPRGRPSRWVTLYVLLKHAGKHAARLLLLPVVIAAGIKAMSTVFMFVALQVATTDTYVVAQHGSPRFVEP
jgi:hypothetical protein